jgi:hypothetical protein
MANGDIHTVKHGDRWVNEVEGGKRASNSGSASFQGIKLAALRHPDMRPSAVAPS